MKNLFLSFFVLCAFLYAPAQDITALLKEAQRLEAVPDEMGALQKYKEVVQKVPSNLPAVTKCSELCSRIGKRLTDKKAKEDFFKAAQSFAELAIAIDPNNSEANCVMAMALGHSSMLKSNKEKIAYTKEIKKYADLAVKLDPQNYKAWHVLGRWHYEISNLNMLERAAVKMFYGGLPPASLKESIKAFEKGNAITGGFILNYYELARAYKSDNQKKKAIAALKTMLALPNHTEEDPILKKQGQKLLKSWE